MQAGRIMGGKYRLERPLAKGAGGTVWVARHLALDIDVALKLLSDRGLTPKSVARFRREARAVARLHGAHVPRVHDLGVDGAQPYIVMELLEGEDLRSRLARVGRVSFPEAMSIIRQAASALDQAHAAGLIHRDLKPANLFVARVAGDEVIKVLDFGIAKDVDSDMEEGATTQGSVLGTPAYMAPEQARGEEIDRRTDLWSLAVVLLELVSGQNPFRGVDLLDTVGRIAWKPLPVPSALQPGLPPGFDAFMERALTRAMTGRFSSVGQFLAALERVASGEMPAPAEPLAQMNVLGREDETVDLPSASRRRAVLDSHPPPSMRPPAAPLSSEEERLECWLVVRHWLSPSSERESSAARISELQRLVRACKGSLDQILDGSLLATFSNDISAREQARLAAHCALALETAVGEGRLVVVVGRQSASRGVLDMTAQARALLEQGPPGILIAPEGVALLADAFVVDTTPTGSGILRGVVPAGRGPRRPLVGRVGEVAALLASADECVRSGTLRSALVTGVAGIGKTRLLQELTSVVAHGARGFDVWYGRADRATARSPFALIADLVRHRISDPPSDRFHQVLQSYAERSLPERDAFRVAAFLGEISAGPARGAADPELEAARLEPRLMYDQVARAFEDLLRAHVGRCPVAIAADQLDAADPASVAILASLVRTLERSPLLVIGAARTDELASHFITPTSRAPLRVELGPLELDAAAQLVRAMVGDGAAKEAVSSITERGGGNPLLLEELAQAAPPATQSVRSASILALAEARILALPVGSRRVLRAASVFGAQFTEAGLRELLRIEPEELGRELSVLAAQDIVEAIVVHAGAAPSEWSFRHAALREAAYEMLPATDREAAHRAAGYYLEGRGGVDAATLARHFDLGGRAKRAGRHYGEAAREALMGNDITRALAAADRARELLPGPDGAVALMTMAEGLLARGDAHTALERSVETLRLLPRGSPHWLTAASLATMAAGRIGEHRICANLARELLELAAPHGRDPSATAFITACARLGHSLLDQSGSRELARRLLLRAELTPEVTEHEQPLARARLCSARAFLAQHDKDLRASWSWLDAAARAFQMVGDRRSAAMAIASQGHAQYQTGMNELAAERLALALELIGHTAPFNRALLQENRGATLGRLGRHDEAISALREALGTFVEIGDRRGAGWSRAYLAPLLVKRDLREAFEQARQAVVDARAQPPLEAYACGVLAQLELDHGDPAKALVLARRAHELIGELGTILEGEAMVRLVHIRALVRAGDTASVARESRSLSSYLVAQAARLGDPELVRAFWENVPEHREALALDPSAYQA